MKSFNEYKEDLFIEGGNVVVTDKNGNQVPAEKIDLEKISRSKFKTEMMKAFVTLNNMYNKEYGEPIWKNRKILDNGTVFNGSSETFFSNRITDKDYTSVKPKVGDIDITVPEDKKEKVWKLLKKITGKKITKFVTYVGDNRPTYSPRNVQINSVLQYNDGNVKVNAQVDFEMLPYQDKGTIPAEFTKFAHSSSWSDMKEGLKGVHQKYLLRAIAGGSSIRDDIVIMTPKATPEKPRVKKLKELPTMLKFSVDRGVRIAYEQQYLDNGKPWVYKGKAVYKEIPTSQSDYEQNLDNIFKLFFSEPQHKQEVHDLWSFLGILGLMKKYHNKKQIKATFDRLMNLYWGRGAQGFERNNPKLDKEIKSVAYNSFIKTFTWLKSENKKVVALQKAYYKQYRMTEISENNVLDETVGIYQFKYVGDMNDLIKVEKLAKKEGMKIVKKNTKMLIISGEGGQHENLINDMPSSVKAEDV